MRLSRWHNRLCPNSSVWVPPWTGLKPGWVAYNAWAGSLKNLEMKIVSHVRKNALYHQLSTMNWLTSCFIIDGPNITWSCKSYGEKIMVEGRHIENIVKYSGLPLPMNKREKINVTYSTYPIGLASHSLNRPRTFRNWTESSKHLHVRRYMGRNTVVCITSVRWWRRISKERHKGPWHASWRSMETGRRTWVMRHMRTSCGSSMWTGMYLHFEPMNLKKRTAWWCMRE